MEPYRVCGKHHPDAHAVQFGSAYRAAKRSKVFCRINYGIPIRHLQCPMNVGVLVEQLDNVIQRSLHLRMVGSHGRNGDEVDRRGELVVDPVI